MEKSGGIWVPHTVMGLIPAKLKERTPVSAQTRGACASKSPPEFTAQIYIRWVFSRQKIYSHATILYAVLYMGLFCANINI